MNLTSELPFWTVRSGLMRIYPPLERDVRCDALVVGGGISGALLANQLIRKGVSCVLIDKRDIGHGSTSASTALLQYEIDTPLYKLRNLVGPQNADRAYRLGIEAVSRLQKLAGTECGFALRPSLQIATSKPDVGGLRREYASRRELGLPVSMLEESDLRRSGLRGAGAIRSSIAAEVDPYRLTHRLLDQASKRGVQIYDRTAGARYARSRNGFTVTTNRRSKIRCRTVFFATGYEARELLPASLVRFKSTYAFVSEPTPDLHWWKDRALIWGTGNPYMYMRTTSDGRVLVGGKDDGVLDPDRRDRQLGRKTPALMRLFHSVFPKVDIEPAFTWAGAFGSTKDGLGYIGAHPAFPGAYFALGFGGNGITFSQIASRVLTDLFLGRRNRDASVFGFDR